MLCVQYERYAGVHLGADGRLMGIHRPQAGVLRLLACFPRKHHA
jgi:hypothetical protein